jgi:hypothetical protein
LNTADTLDQKRILQTDQGANKPSGAADDDRAIDSGAADDPQMREIDAFRGSEFEPFEAIDPREGRYDLIAHGLPLKPVIGDSTAHQLRLEVAQQTIETMLLKPSARWLFDPSEIDGFTKSSLENKVGVPLVYFAECQTDYRNAIKVGCTAQPVRKRMRQIKEGYKLASYPTPIALIKMGLENDPDIHYTQSIEDMRLLEYALHVFFEPHKIVSEWFKAEQVKWFISYWQSMIQGDMGL